MILKSIVLAGVCLLVVSAAPPLRAQGGCASGQDAAVQCFVGNAVRTNLVTLQYGMTMSQFKAYGVSVSKIVQEQSTALAMLGLASAGPMPCPRRTRTAPPIKRRKLPRSIPSWTQASLVISLSFRPTQLRRI
jgi:hypothetical protein